MQPEGLRLAEITARLGGVVRGADAGVRIRQVATLKSATVGDIAFLSNPRYRSQLASTGASAVIIPDSFSEALPLPAIVCANPYAYYARLATLLNPPPTPAPGIHPSVVSASPLPYSAHIAAQVVIGAGVRIGNNVHIHAGCHIGDGVSIGDHCLLHPRVCLYPGSVLGQRVIIHSGCVIGADGFGFAPDFDNNARPSSGEWVKIPQLGRVIIGDDVEIGANTSIDRGALDDTRIGNGVKLDNQIQIAHNCEIGDYTVIAGCTGIAGSTKIGRYCQLGGAAMILGHLEIADYCIISPGTMVMKSIHKAGKYTGILPASEHRQWVKNAAHLRHLEQLSGRIAELEERLKGPSAASAKTNS